MTPSLNGWSKRGARSQMTAEAEDGPFTDIELALPEKGTQVFGSREDWHLNACLGYTALDWRWDWYADGYKRAADMLVEQVEHTGSDQDILVFPIVFLYRHYLEIRLKELLQVSSRCLDESATEVPRHHDLIKLWTAVRPRLEKVWPEGEYHDDVEDLLKQFCRIDAGSFAFRYPVKADGTPTLAEAGSHINLGRVRDAVAGVSTVLDGSSIGLGEYLKAKQEMEAEAYQEALYYAEPPDY